MRYFLDSSALAKRFHNELGTDIVHEIFAQYGRVIFVSELAMVELVSVAGMKQRTGALSANGATTFLRQATVSAAIGDFEVQQLNERDYQIAS